MIEGSCHCGRCGWRFDRRPDRATACNCSVCRRYGAIWAYDWAGEGADLHGPTRVYGWGEKGIEFHFCPDCGGVLAWRAARPDADSRRRLAVNLRMAPIAAVAEVPIRHFDGADSWQALPDDGRCLRDLWF